MSTRQILIYLFDLPWLVFVVYWIIGAANTRRTAQKESFASRYGVMLLVVTSYVLMFDNAADIGVLGTRFLPRTLPIAIAGIVVTWLGVGLACWARIHLGRNWSGRVTIKEGHELIRTGPYSHLRHPIYTGLITGGVGAVLFVGHWRTVLGLVILVVGFSMKAKKEESMLSQQFGEAFQEHRKHTGFLLPRFR